MEILFVLIPVSVVIMLIALAAFIWSVFNEQYDDLEMEAERILFDETPASKTVATAVATAVPTTATATDQQNNKKEKNT